MQTMGEEETADMEAANFTRLTMITAIKRKTMETKALELNETEALILAVALREYLNGFNNRGSEILLTAHPTCRAIIDNILNRLDPAKG